MKAILVLILGAQFIGISVMGYEIRRIRVINDAAYEALIVSQTMQSKFINTLVEDFFGEDK